MPLTPHATLRSASADDHCDAIHAALLARGPQTIHELALHTRLTHVQIARRLPEMRGRAVVTAQTRPGPAGRKCRVWRAAAAGAGKRAKQGASAA